MTDVNSTKAGSTPLDEPRKLAEIVVPAMGIENFSITLDNGARADLTLGSTDQDDCAAFRLMGDQILVAGSDYVRGVKFSLYEEGLLNDYDIGWYLAGANISDIAAMGAIPIGLVSVVRYPKDLPDGRFADLINGIRDCAASVGALNVGGDIGTAERIILSASAFGVVEPEGLLTRRGATPGQIVCVTGPTGLAGSAMKLVRESALHESMGNDFAPLLQRWKRVEPRVAHGRLLARNDSVTSCLDTSDGLKAAVSTLAASSGVGITIDLGHVHVHPAVRRAAGLLDLEGGARYLQEFDIKLIDTVLNRSLS